MIATEGCLFANNMFVMVRDSKQTSHFDFAQTIRNSVCSSRYGQQNWLSPWNISDVHLRQRQLPVGGCWRKKKASGSWQSLVYKKWSGVGEIGGYGIWTEVMVLYSSLSLSLFWRGYLFFLSMPTLDTMANWGLNEAQLGRVWRPASRLRRRYRTLLLKKSILKSKKEVLHSFRKNKSYTLLINKSYTGCDYTPFTNNIKLKIYRHTGFKKDGCTKYKC